MARDLSDEYQRNIPLSEMLASLRQEIKVAQSNAEGENIRFTVPEIELELTMKIKRSLTTEGKLEFFVLAGKHHTENTSEIVHTFKLKMIPEDVRGDNVKSVKVNAEAEEPPALAKS